MFVFLFFDGGGWVYQAEWGHIGAAAVHGTADVNIKVCNRPVFIPVELLFVAKVVKTFGNRVFFSVYLGRCMLINIYFLLEMF